MRIMAIDHGTRRMGIALSDELKMIALPLEFIPAEPAEELLRRLQALIGDKEVSQIIVGMPRNMDGSFGPAAEKVKAFIEDLRSVVEVPIRTWDERLTSVQANRVLRDANVKGSRRREQVDKMAAALLLQTFLDATEGL